jgi:hypothetical protein
MITDVVIYQNQKSKSDWKVEMIIVFVSRYSARCHSSVVSILASYLRGPGFKSQFRDQQS